MPARTLWVSALLALSAAGCSRVPVATAGAADGEAPPKPKVKLAVLVVFDQMRGDFPARFGPLFGDGGFKRLQTQGSDYPNCHYPYANTSTGPGHASILAGCSANKHGVVNNNWYEPKEGEEAYCAGSTRYELVPPIDLGSDPDNLDPRRNKKAKPAGAGTPDRFAGPTLADVLKASTGGKGRVFGLSLKDRAAILPAGRKPDGAYWFEGRFGTSSYYRDSLPQWVADFNRSGQAEKYFGQDWIKLRQDVDYGQYAAADDAPGEGKGRAQGLTFPHPTTGGLKSPGKAYYEAMVNSPYGNDLLLEFTKACVVNEKLGRGAAPDLLTVSFSSNDLVGHTWGPDSHEVMDITLRSDKILAELMGFLDREVGAGQYAMIVTADHGVCPVPETAVTRGHPEARRLSPAPMLLAAERFLQSTFGKPDTPAVVTEPAEGGKPAQVKERNLWIEAAVAPAVYLNRRQIEASKLDRAAVAAKLAAFLRTQDGVLAAYPYTELAGKPEAMTDELLAKCRRSYYPDRGGDVVIVSKPYVYFDSNKTGTGHGTPHDYDTHTVFLAMGPGLATGRRDVAITPMHAAPMLADMLGVRVPANCEYAPPAGWLAGGK